MGGWSRSVSGVAVAAVVVFLSACTSLNKPISGDGGAGSGGSGSGTGGGGGRGGGAGNGPDGGAGGRGGGGASPDGGGPDLGQPPAPAAFALAPPSNDFTAVTVGNTAEATFEVTNTGAVTSGIPAAALGGADAAQFSISDNDCTAGLVGGGHCLVTVRFAPAAAGTKNATLTVSGSPGSTAMATLTGRGVTPGALTLMPTNPPSFGGVVPGSTSTPVRFTLRNSGGTPTGALAVSIMGTSASEFTLSSLCGSSALAGGASCTMDVTFAPSSVGAKNATLLVSANPGGEVSAALSGTALRPAALSGEPATIIFPNVEVGATSATTIDWTITNVGGIATGTFSLTNAAPQDFPVTNNTCTGTLAAGASCKMTIGFKPTFGGDHTALLTLSATPGGSMSTTMFGRGAYKLTVTNAGGGNVVGDVVPINCGTGGTACTALAVPGKTILRAYISNGSNQRFAGWTGGGCPAGVVRVCAVDVTGPVSVAATFAPVTTNLVFVTSDSVATNLGGTAPYDSHCNDMASSAGLNDTAGTAYVAWISDSTASARSRLGSARGWVRLDGKPFADTAASLLDSRQVFNTVLLDETGNPADAGDNMFVMTGTLPDGSVDAVDNCNNWTASSGGVMVGGSFEAGPLTWASAGYVGCGQPSRILCMGKSRSTAVSPQVSSGRKIWLTNTPFIVGAQPPRTPDAQCQAEKPSGVTTAVALVSTTARAASASLVPSTNYVRPDGTLVGTGADLAAGRELTSGIWQTAAGTYVDSSDGVWTGSDVPSVAGTTASTCASWTDNTLTAAAGGFASNVRSWWRFNGTYRCNTDTIKLFCVQTTP